MQQRSHATQSPEPEPSPGGEGRSHIFGERVEVVDTSKPTLGPSGYGMLAGMHLGAAAAALVAPEQVGCMLRVFGNLHDYSSVNKHTEVMLWATLGSEGFQSS